MAARIPQEVREKQIAELCEGTIYSFVGWKDEYLRNTSKIVCNCSVHGNWVCRLADFINGSRCRKCANEKFSLERRHGVDVWRKRIEDRIAETGYHLASMGGNFKNQRSKVTLKCTLHGEFTAIADNVVNGRFGCPKCSGCYRFTEEESRLRIIDKIGNRPYDFVDFYDGHTLTSKVTLRCHDHGEWTTSIRNFLYGGIGCPVCAKGSFKKNSVGYLYLLLSENGRFVKVGISGRLKNRLSELRCRTPFDFSVMDIVKFEKGEDALSFEKMIHNEFESANLEGFQGCTEWLKWNPAIPLWFKYLNG